MALLLLVLFFFLVTLLLIERSSVSAKEKSLHFGPAALKAFVFCGALIYASVELLSLFEMVTFVALTVLWSGVVLGLLIVARKRIIDNSIAVWKTRKVPSLFSIVLLLMAGLLLVLAVGVAPNNWDSMTYHLSRVEYWIQNKSVFAYPTQNLRQIYYAPFAEYWILHFRLLSGGEWFSNCVQWVGYCVAIIGVREIVGALGGGERAKTLAAVLAATMPMMILQSTTPQNDLFAGAWFVVFLYFGIRVATNGKLNSDLIYCAISLSLALLAKSTIYIYAFPFCIGLIVARVFMHRFKWQEICIIGSVFVLLVVAANAPFLVRNAREFGHPIGPRQEGFDYRPISENSSKGLRSTTSNLMKYYLVHFDLLSLAPGHPVNDFARWIHQKTGLDFEDKGANFGNPNFKEFRVHEDTSGNLILALLIPIAVLLSLLDKKKRNWMHLGFWGCLFLGIVLLSFQVKWQIWSSRLHTGLFLGAVPLVAISLDSFKLTRKLSFLIVLGALFYAVPFLLINQRKPLIPLGLLGNVSVFTNSRDEVRFIDRPELLQDYEKIQSLVEEHDVKSIGIVLGKNAWEYPIVRAVRIGSDNQCEIRSIRYPEFLKSRKKIEGRFSYEAIITKYDWVPEVFNESDIQEIFYCGTYEFILFNKAQNLIPVEEADK